ncbi:hypothetical protein TWF225_006222 [Orbilia oligospora]|uniref:Uncharacterized protein n=1 Tax=Orbilia oligospora TaxID=2813651 RepID=A0A7C8PE72_ORBOL|nr:hypothetical protein TWF751_009956 [Orbilia oligospora]KAF3183766.1 hypothetical protein TWF225_006222 [Orbilia oligospora]KAF3242320.1 hypothetical protein TWF128_010557 [Orbilia oligospora]KAF3246845.1 hypothetical protein TWF217_009861 [Orbilia oligospora]KAF3282561.1 hypothetical protein TWF132_010590 [Orbilia oligospora]
MSASAAPIPLDQFAAALLDLEVPQLHQESARLQNSLYHLERSNTTLAEYPDDEDCKDAIRYNHSVIEQQKQRVDIIRLELVRRGVSVGHMDLDIPGSSAPVDTQATVATSGSSAPANGAANGHAGEDEGVYL